MVSIRAMRQRRAIALASLVAVGVSVLCGCASPTAPPPTASPAAVIAADPLAAFAWAAAPGANSLRGVVAYHPRKSEKWSCSEQSVALMPEAPASRARVAALYGSTSFAVRPVAEVREKSKTAGDVNFSAFVKQATCDADGRFSFDHLADGNYFVIARAKQIQPRVSNADDGVAIVQRITLVGGKAIDIRVPVF